MSQSNKEFSSGQPIIGQLISLIPSEIFSEVAISCKSDEKFRTMTSKAHFVCLFYAVLTKNSSLREVCKNITLIGRKLISYGLNVLPCKSTLSDANRKRSSDYFAQVYQLTFEHYQPYLKSKHFSFPIGGEVDVSCIDAFDSTTLTLFKEIMKGAGRNAINGKKKGGMKAFTKMNLADGVPNFVCFKAASQNENTFLKVLELEKGSISLFDKGFNKYQFFDKMTQQEKFYVTRSKDNAKYTVVGNFLGLEKSFGILKDELIELTYREKGAYRTVVQRLITYKDPVSDKILTFLTNLMDLKGSTVTLLYKNRWTIEVLFKQLKQNFELKYFLSDSENGIKSQVWVALILNLLFTVLHKITKEAEDFSTMVQVAAKNLCSYVNFIKFLTDTSKYCRDWYDEEIGKVQLDLFRN